MNRKDVEKALAFLLKRRPSEECACFAVGKTLGFVHGEDFLESLLMELRDRLPK